MALGLQTGMVVYYKNTGVDKLSKNGESRWKVFYGQQKEEFEYHIILWLIAKITYNCLFIIFDQIDIFQFKFLYLFYLKIFTF